MCPSSECRVIPKTPRSLPHTEEKTRLANSLSGKANGSSAFLESYSPSRRSLEVPPAAGT